MNKLYIFDGYKTYKPIMNRLLVILFLGMFGVQLSAQFNYERYYNPNFRDHVTKDISTTRDGYAILNQNFIDDQDTSYAANVGFYSVKGNIVNTTDHVFGDSILLRRVNNMQLLGDGSLLLSNTLDTSSQNKVVSFIEANGDVKWSNAYGTVDSFPEIFSANYNAGILALNDSLFMHFNYANDSTMTALYLAGLDTLGMPAWESTFNYRDTLGNSYNEEWGNIISNREEGFSACGTLDGEDNAAFLMAMDSMGVLDFARVYRDTSPVNLSVRFNDIIQLADSSYLCVGNMQDPQAVSTFGSIITRVDSTGNMIWAKRLVDSVIGGNTITEITTRNGETILTVKATNILGVTTLLMVALDAQGDIDWQTQYKNIIPRDLNTKCTVVNKNDELACATTGISDLGTEVPYLVVAGDQGETLCSTESTRFSLMDIMLQADTANFVTEAFVSDIVAIPVTRTGFSSYDVPTSSLETINLCPDQANPIDTLVDATVEGAASYLWSTDETTAAIRVMEEGQFNVEITFDSAVCFTLCDTFNVNVLPLPTVSIDVDASQYCSDINRPFVLVSNPFTVTPYVYDWDTGDDERAIVVNGFGTYALTITDGCGETASTSVTISEQDVQPAAEINFNVDALDCFTPSANVSMVTPAPNEILQFTDIVWTAPDGTVIAQDVSVLIVTQVGTYTVTGTDDCLYPFTETFTIDQNDLGSAVDPVFTSSDNTDCKTGPYQIILNNFSQFAGVQWPGGTMDTEGVTVPDAGDYDVILTDNCGVAQTAVVTVIDEETPAFIEPLLAIDTVAFCINGFATISVVNAQEYTQIQWFDNTIGSSVQVTEDGSYTANLTDLCGNEGTGTATVSDLENCDEGCLLFPNLVIPSSELEESRVFRPVSRCIGEITNYRLRIFDRWGELIFESTDPDQAWNATLNDEAIQGDVYIYVATYTVSELENETKGDITVLR